MLLEALVSILLLREAFLVRIELIFEAALGISIFVVVSLTPLLFDGEVLGMPTLQDAQLLAEKGLLPEELLPLAVEPFFSVF